MADGSFVVSDDDAELLSRSFKIHDPESLSGLIREIPKNAESPVIEFRYDVNPGKATERDYIYCAHCRKRTHWKGYVISLALMGRATVGHCCGKDQFGFEFGRVENSFNRLADRQSVLNRIISTKPQLSALRLAVADLRSGRLFETMDDLRREARLNWKEFESRLAQNIINENYLVAEYDEVDLQGYEREKQSIIRYYDRKLSNRLRTNERQTLKNERARKLCELRPKTVNRRNGVGTIRGTKFLNAPIDFESRANAITKSISNVSVRLIEKQSGEFSDKELKELWKEVCRITDCVRNICTLANEFICYFEKENLEAICKWAAIAVPELCVSYNSWKLTANPCNSSLITIDCSTAAQHSTKLKSLEKIVTEIA